MALTGRTAVIAALGAPAVGLLMPGWHGILGIAVPLLVLVLADLALAAPVRPLAIDRHGPTSVRQGEPAEIHLRIANASSRLLRADVRDAWPPSCFAPGTSYEATRHRITLPAGQGLRLTTVLRPTRRGDRRAARVTIRSYGPLGLAARQGNHRVPWTVRVLPPFASRKHLPAKLARLRELDGRTSVLIRGEGTEFDSLREYIPGDDVRSIDWRATARRSEVTVRTWRPERDRHLLLVLDTGRTAAGRVGDVPRLDASMDAALLLTALASRAGDRVDLLAYDRRQRAAVRGRTVTDVLPAVVQALSTLEPELVETDSPGLAAATLAAAPRRSLVVLFSTLESGAAESGLLPVIPRLTRRHTVLVAAVADPRIEEMAAARGTVPEVYEAAAAARHQAERRELTGRLRALGVTVVDAAPEELAPAVTDAYLALKAAGKL